MPAATGREQVGTVLSKRGKVTARQAGQTEARILKRGDPIYADDAIHTVRGANIQLKMSDQNIIMLRGGCIFRVNLYRPSYSNTGLQRFEYIGGALRESRREPQPALANYGLYI